MTGISPILDHAVVNVHGKLDAMAERYRSLGFQLTERGHHSLGSSNHLAIFGENYLELLGYETGRGATRADLWRHPPGLTGLAFKTDDALHVHETLAGRGVAIENPAEFSRPVALPEGERDAAFRVVRLGTERVPNGRVFFCQHLTPDLVWREEWRSHPNGVTDIVECVVGADDPFATSALYEEIFGPHALAPVSDGFALAAGRATILILARSAIAERFEGCASSEWDGPSRMVAVTLRTRALSMVDACLSEAGIGDIRRAPGRIILPERHAGGVALVFTV